MTGTCIRQPVAPQNRDRHTFQQRTQNEQSERQRWPTIGPPHPQESGDLEQRHDEAEESKGEQEGRIHRFHVVRVNVSKERCG